MAGSGHSDTIATNGRNLWIMSASWSDLQPVVNFVYFVKKGFADVNEI